MKRKVLLSADDQTVEATPSNLPVLNPVEKLNPAPVDSDMDASFIPTKEEKETITMTDDSLPQIDTSLFSKSGETNVDDGNNRIDWTATKPRGQDLSLIHI